MRTNRVVVTGASGQLGQALKALLADEALPLSHAQLDITSPGDIERVLRDAAPRAVVNCAAYTYVDGAEKEPQAARRINADAVALLATACETRDIPLVHISTDYVFTGDAHRTTPYREDDPPEPVNEYARGKLAGEKAAAQCPKHFVVRTCGLYGPSAHGKNFVETMLRLASAGRSLSVVDDQRCTPSYAADVAKAIAYLLTTTEYGTYHIVNAGETTWCQFAGEILRLAKLEVPLRAITSEDYGGTPRPKYSVLDMSKYRALGGPAMRAWQAALEDYLRQRPK
jgi:dTDP-4-dehydrorhamnose reductase